MYAIAAVILAVAAIVVFASGGIDALYTALVRGWDRMNHMVLSQDMWMLILGGLKNTVIIFIFAAIVAMLLGSFLAYLSISRRWPWLHKPLSWFVTTLTDIPAVALMMFFYYVIFAGEMNGIVVSVIALGVYTSGFISRMIVVHTLQIDKGQIEAGRALGMTTRQCYRYIVLPQAVKSMLPIFIGHIKQLLRATSYAGYIAQNDLIRAVSSIQEKFDGAFLPLVIVSILYLILSWAIANIIQFLYIKLFKHD